MQYRLKYKTERLVEQLYFPSDTHRDRILPLLKSLCSGATEEDLPAAVQGVVSEHAAVRAAALSALSCVPLLGEGLPLPGVQQLVELYIARHDPHEENRGPAEQLWEQVSGAVVGINTEGRWLSSSLCCPKRLYDYLPHEPSV